MASLRIDLRLFLFFLVSLFVLFPHHGALGKDDGRYTPPKPLKEAKTAVITPPVPVPPPPTECAPHCCDVEMHVVKKQGEAEAALGKAAQQVVNEQTLLQNAAEKSSAAHLGAESQNVDNAVNMSIKKATADSELAENKKNVEEKELNQLKETDTSLESEVAEMEALAVAEEEKELRHEKHEMNELTREEKKLKDKMDEQMLEKDHLEEQMKTKKEKDDKIHGLKEEIKENNTNPSVEHLSEIAELEKEITSLEENELHHKDLYKEEKDNENKEKFHHHLSQHQTNNQQTLDTARDIQKHISPPPHINVAKEVEDAEFEIRQLEREHQPPPSHPKEEENKTSNENTEETNDETEEEEHENEPESHGFFSEKSPLRRWGNDDGLLVFKLYPNRRTYHQRFYFPSNERIKT